MSTHDIWTLHFNLTEFTPREVEGIITLSTLMQRDWRHRGFLAKSDKHARFTLIPLAEALVMKAFADRGIGPSRSHVVAPRIAAAVIWNALAFRSASWGGPSIVDVFDAIPKDARALTTEEEYGIKARALMTPLQRERVIAAGGDPDAVDELDDFSKASSMADRVFGALGIGVVERSKHVIWWPNDEVVFGNYDELTSGRDLDEPGLPDPRFDGVALVLSIDAMASNLVRRLPRPLVFTALEVFNQNPSPPLFWGDRGKVSVSYGKAAYAALLASLDSVMADGGGVLKSESGAL